MSNEDLATPEFFPATRETALHRMNAFTQNMGKTYASKRNTDFGPENRFNVSCLSPYLSHRLLLEKDVAEAAIEAHGLQTAEKFVQEVFWRTYFKGWLELRPHVWSRYTTTAKSAIEGLSGGQKVAFEEATGGKTGIDCFDQWTHELVETGYLHNHARMWYASIWIFTLKLPWVLGADFFYRHLLDGDAASNTLSWRWVAGLHTKGKNYVARADNIEKHTDGRFNPEGKLAEDPAPLDDDWNGEAGPAPTITPLDKSRKALLLLHEDDLGFDSLDLGGLDVRGIAAITVTDSRSPYGASEPVKQFTIEAVEDALNRADDAMDADAVKLPSPEAILQHAKDIGAEQVVMPYIPQGPVRDRINQAASSWESEGVKRAEILRPEDSAAWPHCAKGFFKLKEKIPSLIKG
ncbi:hypothetical protein HK107_13630 [Parvularcula sp. ZS-1/3]|uniref:Cryptochrome/DNA photolyase FAD-binding domain-containing protein n=1 Tax=Parvularcula mediterranea TaxID=2732508 RepID=A0A7Y3RQ84_9PROT|nr:FAD-binding domain-containing protein [Parvularcula mediterranea]NNU17367.1 hypothetical protein [Parvularcula mediterranea]